MKDIPHRIYMQVGDHAEDDQSFKELSKMLYS